MLGLGLSLPETATRTTLADWAAAALPEYFGQVANRTFIPNKVTSTATKAAKNRSYMVLLAPARYLTFGYFSGAAVDVDADGSMSPSGDVTRHVVIEVNGQLKEATFGGITTGTILSGQFGLSDVVDLGQIYPAGTAIYHRQVATVVSGGLPYTNAGGALNGTFSVMHGEQNITSTTAVTDDILSVPAGQPLSGANANTMSMLGPIAVLSWTSTPAYMIISNSRDQGNDDQPNTARGDVGNCARCLGEAGYPYINASASSDRIDWFLFNPYVRKLLSKYVSHVIIGDVGNDMKTAGNAWQVRSADFAKAAALEAASNFPGKTLVLSDTLPFTPTATDRTTEAGQSLDANVAQINLYNDWVYTLPAPFSAFIKLCSYYESATARGKWRASVPALTGDGVHPTQAAYTGLPASGVFNAPATSALAPQAQQFSPWNLLNSSGDYNTWFDAENPRSAYTGPGLTAGTIYGRTNSAAFTQGTVAKQPVFTPNAIGSAPAWRLTKGSNQGWAGSPGIRNFVNGKTAHTTIMLVQKNNAATAGEYFFWLTTNNDTNARLSFGPSNSGSVGKVWVVVRKADADSSNALVSLTDMPIGTPVVLAFQVDLIASRAVVRMNGTTIIDAALTGSVAAWEATTPDFGYLGVGSGGTTAPGDYDLKEVFSYGGAALSLDQIQRVEGYMAHRPSLSAAVLPLIANDHPYKESAPPALLLA